jgi:hypothetical protein
MTRAQWHNAWHRLYRLMLEHQEYGGAREAKFQRVQGHMIASSIRAAYESDAATRVYRRHLKRWPRGLSLISPRRTK